jgi:hypothetical protein
MARYMRSAGDCERNRVGCRTIAQIIQRPVPDALAFRWVAIGQLARRVPNVFPWAVGVCVVVERLSIFLMQPISLRIAFKLICNSQPMVFDLSV